MADNVHALLLYLSSSESPLPALDFGYTRPSTVFFSHLGYFFKYSYSTARILYSIFLVASLVLVAFTWQNPAPALRSSGGRGGWIKENLKATGAAGVAFIGALIGVNLVAAVMQYALGRNMSWYAVELSALALYGPAALAGTSSAIYIFIKSLASVRTQHKFGHCLSRCLLHSAPCRPSARTHDV